MTDYAKSMEAAREAVHYACAVCRDLQGRLGEMQSRFKDDKSPVTVADFASQAMVAYILTARLGRVRLVAEEDAAALRAQIERGDSSMAEAVAEAVRPWWDDVTVEDVLDAIDVGNAEPASSSGLHGFWTLDPIDGTKGFLRGGQYAVSLAWIEHGAPLIGVLGCPNLSLDYSRPFDDLDPRGVLYLAASGEGVVEAPGDDPAAHANKVVRLEPAEGEPVRLCESVESGHTSHDLSERVLERLGEPAEPARLDSQAKYAVVARGQADLYLRLPQPPKPGKGEYIERIWDHAAGALVAREAGCAVTDVFGRELDFGHGKGLEKNRGVVVAPVRLHGMAIGALEELGSFRHPE